MRTTSHIRWLVFGLMMAFGFAPAVTRADITVPLGTDYLLTLQPTFYNFNLPGVGIEKVNLTGNPIVAGGFDTIVQRLGDADATTGASINTQITGLSLVGTTSLGNVSVTLDPTQLANDTGTMSLLVTSPTIPGTEISGTITDTLNVYFLATIQGQPTVIGVEHFTSSGFWEAFLPFGSNEVVDFSIDIDTHVDPFGVHTVSSVPEPSTWIAWAMAGLVAPIYARWRRRRS